MTQPDNDANRETAVPDVALDEMSRRVAHVLMMHTPHYEINGTTYKQTCMMSLEDMSANVRERHICITEQNRGYGDEPCHPEWDEHQVDACRECRTSTADYEIAYFPFPCPTVKVLLEGVPADA